MYVCLYVCLYIIIIIKCIWTAYSLIIADINLYILVFIPYHISTYMHMYVLVTYLHMYVSNNWSQILTTCHFQLMQDDGDADNDSLLEENGYYIMAADDESSSVSLRWPCTYCTLPTVAITNEIAQRTNYRF